MCIEIISTTEHRCGHRIDQAGSLIAQLGCGNCGKINKTEYLGRTTKKIPCDDCIANGEWVKNARNKWVHKREMEQDHLD